MTHEERIRLDEETEQVEELINLAKLQVWELIGEYLKDRLGKFSEKDLNDYSHVFSYILPNLFSRYVEKQRKMIYDLGGKEE